LRINDAVQKPGGVLATETDLNSAIGDRHLKKNENHTDAILFSSSEGAISRAITKLQISQTIKWEVKFIKHLSDISRRMDISGEVQKLCGNDHRLIFNRCTCYQI
jgi:hypothetical protein